jgi:hypothetical protein
MFYFITDSNMCSHKIAGKTGMLFLYLGEGALRQAQRPNGPELSDRASLSGELEVPRFVCGRADRIDEHRWASLRGGVLEG